MKPMIVGSRGSALALAQTRLVVADLKRAWAGRNFEIHVIKTKGDQLEELPLAEDQELGKGLFTGELERALLDREIDLAVHSLKDLPTSIADGLMLAAIPKRADPHDVLITKEGADPEEKWPYSAVFATGSPRRAAQLRALRQDLSTADIRGNIDTRLKKFRENAEWFGLIIAAAGLERLKPNLDGLTVTPMPFSQMLPAPGQGALALQTRKDDAADIRNLVRKLHDPDTAAAVTAERMFLEALGGGCREPIAAYAEVCPEDRLKITGVAWLIGETFPRRGELTGRLDKPEELGVELAVEVSR